MEIKNTTQTNFVKFFGRNTRMKVLDFLIENDRTSWNLTEIMYHARVGHTCLLDELKDLLELQIIKLDNRKYSINKKCKITTLIISIWNEINKVRIEQEKKSK